MPPKPTLLYGAGALPALNASITTLAPLTAGMPKLSAAWPDRKLTMPILKVSCAWAVVPNRNNAAAPMIECAKRWHDAARCAVEAMDVSVGEPARRAWCRQRGTRSLRGAFHLCVPARMPEPEKART